eukprot:7736458-Pyramimonas_sp.AAC.2
MALQNRMKGGHRRTMGLSSPACGLVLDLRKPSVGYVGHVERQSKLNATIEARPVDLHRQLRPIQTINNSSRW